MRYDHCSFDASPPRIAKTVTVALAILLAFPGLAVLGDAEDPDPARFEADIGMFESQDAELSPSAGSVLFLGSSSIRLWPLDESFPDLPTVNRGFGGSHYSDIVYFADRILAPHQPATVVVYAGDNDIAAGKSPQQVADDCRRLMTRLRAHVPSARIVVIAIKPSPSRWEHFPAMQQANALIRADVASMENAEWVDVVTPMIGSDRQPCCELFVDDCLHLNKQGYQLWSKLVGCAIRREPFQTGS